MRCRGAIRVAVTFPNSGVIVGEGELCDAGVQYGLLSHSPTMASLLGRVSCAMQGCNTDCCHIPQQWRHCWGG